MTYDPADLPDDTRDGPVDPGETAPDEPIEGGDDATAGDDTGDEPIDETADDEE